MCNGTTPYSQGRQTLQAGLNRRSTDPCAGVSWSPPVFSRVIDRSVCANCGLVGWRNFFTTRTRWKQHRDMGQRTRFPSRSMEGQRPAGASLPAAASPHHRPPGPARRRATQQAPGADEWRRRVATHKGELPCCWIGSGTGPPPHKPVRREQRPLGRSPSSFRPASTTRAAISSALTPSTRACDSTAASRTADRRQLAGCGMSSFLTTSEPVSMAMAIGHASPLGYGHQPMDPSTRTDAVAAITPGRACPRR